MVKFELGKIYVASHRVDRYFFEVVAKTARIVTVKLVGKQENCSSFDMPQITIPLSDDSTQKIRIYLDEVSGVECGSVKIKYKLWGKVPRQDIAELNSMNFIPNR